MGIITAEALYPALYTTNQQISDLGGTRPPDSIVLQTSAAIFDITMLVTGAMIIVAAFLVHRAFRRRAVTISLGCYGAGVLLVGVFPGNTALHPYVAMFVFLAAGVAAVLASKVPGPRHSAGLSGWCVCVAGTRKTGWMCPRALHPP